jgi:hypothetical protein
MELLAGAFKLLFWILIFIVFRMSRWAYQPHRVLRAFRRVTADLAARHGGELHRAGHRRLIYSFGNGKEIEVNCFGRPRLIVRIRESFTERFALQRIPRMLYAFIESFIPSHAQINGHPYLISGSFQLLNKSGFLPLFEQLSQAQVSVDVTGDMLMLSKRLRPNELNEFALMDLVHKAETLAALCSAPTLIIPVQPVGSDSCCAYCKESLIDTTDVVYCSSCNTAHHVDCFELNAKCAVFGCASSVTIQPQSATIAN